MGVTHLLDYGCGHNVNLFKNLKVKNRITYQAYDPGVPRFSKPPLPAQLVACIDVLEHIEPALIDNVLDDLKRVTEGILFATICTAPARKTLPDGRNAHLIQQPVHWWAAKLWERFEVQTLQKISEHNFLAICEAKFSLQKPNGDLV